MYVVYSDIGNVCECDYFDTLEKAEIEYRARIEEEQGEGMAYSEIGEHVGIYKIIKQSVVTNYIEFEEKEEEK